MSARSALALSLALAIGATASEPTILIPAGSDWKYWDGVTAPVGNWQEASFDDSQWKSGPAPLGYSPNKEDGEVTDLSYGASETNKIVAYYFRRQFALSMGSASSPQAGSGQAVGSGQKAVDSAHSTSSGQAVRCRVRADDGVVVYVNGKEVWRNLMPEGVIGSGTLAVGAVADETRWNLASLPAETLRQGTNIVAVEVHQASPSSSDLRFDLSLTMGESAGRCEEGKPFVLPIGKTAMAFVWVPPGEVKILGGDDHNALPNPRTIKPGFWMGKFEVTQSQWEELMTNNPSHFQGSDLPVEGMTWDAYMEFCQKLNALRVSAGIDPTDSFCLPTQKQWEYACRATNNPESRLTFANGDDEADLARIAWYGANSKGKTHSVGAKAPNNWGLCDMCGNVWEYCQDWNRADDNETRYSVPGVPYDDVGMRYRALCGGSWFSTASGCRPDHRGRAPDVAGGSVGFRVILIQEGVSP